MQLENRGTLLCRDTNYYTSCPLPPAAAYPATTLRPGSPSLRPHLPAGGSAWAAGPQRQEGPVQPDAPPDFASGAATPTSRALGAVPAFACGQESTPILRLLESGHPPLGCARNTTETNVLAGNSFEIQAFPLESKPFDLGKLTGFGSLEKIISSLAEL